MPEVTIRQYAEVIGISVDRLIEQLEEAGLEHKSADEVISDNEKTELLSYLRRKHGKDEKSEPRKITLKRKTISELKVPVTASSRSKPRSKTINVEFRKRRTYVKRSVIQDEAAEKAAELEKEEMQAIVREGLKLGKHTAAHAHGAEGIKNAVAAGVRTIEHGTLADDQALEMIREAGAFLVPTMSPRRLFLKHADQVPPFIVEKSKQMIEETANLVSRAKAAGVSIAMGTDAGTNFNYHGDNAQELVSLVEEDMLTPLEALSAATATAAKAVMLDHEVGVLAPGKAADMLILDENPLENIRVLCDPSKKRVVFGGIPVV